MISVEKRVEPLVLGVFRGRIGQVEVIGNLC